MPHPMLSLTLMGVLMALIAVSVKRIPEGQVYTLRRIGGHMRTLGAGTHLVWPLIERVIHRIRLLGNVVDLTIPLKSGRTLRGCVYVQVVDAERADPIIDSVGDVLGRCIPAMAEDLAQQDDPSRNRHLKTELNCSLKESGLLITRVQLTLA
jgi:regulator of protease activity HflC (stomatin/prohibitin superfamily)